nr:hypothetical protein BdHM001_34650 [Bdellovibrio sp. HM001]
MRMRKKAKVDNSKNPSNDDVAMGLLMEIVSCARNDRPYKEMLPQLKEALEKAPKISKAVAQSLSDHPDIITKVC